MDKRIVTLNFFLLQLCLLSYVLYSFVFNCFRDYEISKGLAVGVVGLIVTLSTYSFIQYVRLLAEERRAQKVANLLKQANNLFFLVSAKHQDFVNHLQVIMGLMQMNHHEEAVNYIKDLSEDLIGIEKLICLKRPEVAALISTKIAGLSYVKLNLDINTSLEKLKISPIELVDVLEILLDISIYEVSELDDKSLTIKINEDIENFIFEINNPRMGGEGSKIKEENYRREQEIDLEKVKKFVNRYGGGLFVDLENDANRIFIIKLPKALRPMHITLPYKSKTF